MLSQVQSQLVAWAFYVAYFVGSIIFFLVSLKVDVLQLDIKRHYLLVLLSAFGSFMFVPAATMEISFFLTALFTVGLGFQFSKLLLIH
jgi:FHS family L-fucose permease-like MFS transporter